MGTGMLAATVAIAFLLLVPGHKSLALGQVVEKLRSAQRVSFLVEQRSADPKRPGFKARVWLMDPDKSRVEWNMPQGNTVGIRNGNKTVQLDATKKTAIVGAFPPGVLGSERQALEELRSLVEKDARSLGEKVIDGVRAKGFEALIKERKITLWANTETGNPIRIEYPLTEIPPPNGPELKVLTDFKFDEPFDPNLFTLEVPRDYQVSDFNTRALMPMDHMLAILRLYAQQTGGEFPPRIDDHGQTIGTKLGVPEDSQTMTAEQRKLVEHLAGIEFFLKQAKAGRHFQYYAGAKLGEKDRVVFWCVDPPPITGTFIPLIPRPDAGPPSKPEPVNEKYLTVYGDLRVEKLNEAPLPPPGSDKE
jgi:outer membrane lipoprotein-sorting protein